MEIAVDEMTAIRTVISTSSSTDSWVRGTPEINGYCGTKTDGSIGEGSSVTLKPVFYVLNNGTLQQGDVAQKLVHWTSSDESVATVDSSGKVTAVSQGTAVITGVTEDGGHSFSCAVKVTPAPIKGVEIGWDGEADDSFNPGEIRSLKVTCTSGAVKNIVWTSSDEKVVSVDSYGKVTAISCGKAVITAAVTDNAGSADVIVKMNVEVSNKTVEEIGFVDVEDGKISIVVGNTKTLRAEVTPTDATITAVTWNVAEGSSVSIVNNSDGTATVTAKSVGTSVIVATANDGSGVSARCEVVVGSIPATTMSINQSSLTIEVNKSAKLSATVGPSDATDLTVAWSVVKGSCVYVDQNGNITATSEGTAVIRATANGGSDLYKDCTVTVVDYSVKSIDMTSSAKLEVGKTVTLTVEVSPSNAKNKSVTWTSSNPSVATVSSGVVTAVSAGTAIITATSSADSSITATCVVTVTDSLSQVKSVTLDKTSLAMEVNSKVTVTATIDPEVTGAELVWTVSNGTGSVSVVKNSDGTATVTAKSAGSASLIVTVKGTQVSATCDITIASTETKVVSEETKENDDGTTTDTKVEEIDTGKGSTTTKTTETVKDTDGNVKGSTSTYEFTSDDPAIKTKTTVTVTEDANGNVGQPKVQVDMGNVGSSSNGTRSITVNADDLKEAIKQLDRAKVVTGIDDLDKNIEIQADEGKDVDQMVTTLDAASISDLSSADGVSLSISSEMGRMQIGSEVFTTMKEQGGKATLSVKKSDDQTSVPDALSKVGQKTLFEVDMTVGGKTVHQLNGNVTLSLPFALSDGQDPSKVGVRYVDADGNLSSETFRATYADGMVSFTTTHFSTFAVVYGDVASDSGKDTTTTVSGDSSMASLCVVLAALAGAFAATTVMFVLRMKGKI